MGKERAAVLGVGQTKYQTTYPGSMAGMLRDEEGQDGHEGATRGDRCVHRSWVRE